MNRDAPYDMWYTTGIRWATTGCKVGNLVLSQYVISLECQDVWKLFKPSESSGDPNTILGNGK